MDLRDRLKDLAQKEGLPMTAMLRVLIALAEREKLL
jgi:hypothetical protein